jgi:uncharacterized membrane protein
MPRHVPVSSAASPPRPSRGLLQAILAGSIIGLGLALYLVQEHWRAHAGLTSFCNINDVFNCDKVATSRYAVFMGLPVAVWGAFGYLAIGTLSAWGLSKRRLHATWPRGLLLAFTAFAVASSLVLAAISELVIQSWCLVCMASWLTSAVLFVLTWRATRPAGPAAALRADLSALRARPGLWAGLGALALVVVAGSVAAYPNYWEYKRASPDHPQVAQGPDGGKGPLEPVEIIEYSDYECPFCARANQQAHDVLAARPDVRVIRRQFPLDNTCNQALSRQVHAGSCALARAGICAEDQGRITEMDDALFGNQQDRVPVEVLAQRIGLDLPRFRACLSAPETEARLAADIAAGVRINLQATPTWVINGTSYTGLLPADKLPPPKVAQPTPQAAK